MRTFYTWLIILLFFFNSQLLYSQYNSIWLEGIEGISNQRVNDVTFDPTQGKVYVVGQFEGDISASFPTGFNGSSDFSNAPAGLNGFLAQYDTTGSLGWAIWIGGSGDDRISSIDIGESGSLYITGTFVSSADFEDIGGGSTTTSTNFGAQDVFEAKYSSAGILSWLHEDGGIGDDLGLSVAVDTNFGQVYFIGHFEVNAEVGGFNIGSILNSTIESFVLSRNLNGNAQWVTETMGLTGDNMINDITLDPDSVYIGGVFNSSLLQFNNQGTIYPGLSNVDLNDEIILASLSQTSGSLNWQEQIKNNTNDILGGILYNNNNLYLTGALTSNATFPFIGNVSTASGHNLFLSKHNALDGETIWAKVENPVGGSNAIGRDIGFDNSFISIIGSNDGVIRFDGNSSNDLVANGMDGFIALYEPISGSFFQRMGVSSNGIVRTRSITSTGNNQFYFAGSSQQSLTVDTSNLLFSFSNNACIGKIAMSSPCNSNFTYNSSNYCSADTNQFPTIVGQSGGVFSSNISGLDIQDSISGEVSIVNSIDAAYTIYYDIGSCRDTFNLEIIDPSFIYSDTLYCDGDPNDTAIVMGNYTGLFSCFPTDLNLDSLTGYIDFTDTSQTYMIYHDVGLCRDSFELEVISDEFSYSSSIYCAGSTNPTPTITGLPGGVFSSNNFIIISGSTGEINLSLSNDTTYMIFYNIIGTSCIDTFNLEIIDPSFSYSDTLFCDSGPNVTPIINGNYIGNFNALPLGLSLDSTNGIIDFSLSTDQLYTIYQNTQGCMDSFDLEIVNPGINFSDTIFCKGMPNDTGVVLGNYSGLFTSFPLNVYLDPIIGEIDLDSSLAQYYTIYHDVFGCIDSFDLEIISAEFSYWNDVYCSYALDTVADITGNVGGIFSSDPKGVIFNDSITGDIDFSNSYDTTFSIYYEVLSCRDSFDLEVIDLIANAGVDRSVCGMTYQLMGSYNPNANYYWLSPNGLSFSPSDTIFNPTVTVDTSGLYEFVIELTEKQCFDSDTIVVNFVDSLVVDAGPDQIVNQSTANLNATSNGEFNYWENMNMMGTILQPDSLQTGITDLNSGDYVFRITTFSSVCPSVYDEVNYYVDWIFIPSGFSPNGDGINDVFLVEGPRLNVDFEMQIVNRWGELLYVTSDIFKGWDGTVNGAWSPEDTYFYFIRITTHNYNGYIELKR